MDPIDAVDLATALLRGQARRVLMLVLAGCIAAGLWASDAMITRTARMVGCVVLNRTVDEAHDELDELREKYADSEDPRSAAIGRERFLGC